MSPSISVIAAYSLIPASGMLIGGAITSFFQPKDTLTSATQHFAAGVVFAAVAKELLPKLGAESNLVALLIGFTVGVISMLLLKKLTSKLSNEESKGTGISYGLISAVGIDLMIDGILIGVSFLVGTKGGILIASALAIEIFFLGLSTTASLGARHVSVKTRLLLTLVLASLIPLGSIFGATLLSQLPKSYTDGLLAFGVAALLYLVTEELLVEAHTQEVEPPLVTTSFFLGFLSILVLEGLTG